MLVQLVAPLLATASPVVVDLPPLTDQQSEAPDSPGAAGAADNPLPDAEPVPVADDESAPVADGDQPGGGGEMPAEPQEPGNEILVVGRAPSEADPVEELNAVSYEAVQAVDKAVIAPVTHAYQSGIPEPIRDGTHNVLNNLDEPIVFVNFLLQLKIGKAFETLARFAINSTLGVAGLFDVAKKKPFNLPRRSNGFADTLGYYGVGPGPYLFLPLIGSTTVRDLAARPLDLLILPTILAKPFAQSEVVLTKSTLSALDERDQNDDKLKRLQAAPDPYVAQREEYLARRRAEIEVLKGLRKSIDDPPYYELPELPEDEEALTEASPDLQPAPVETVEQEDEVVTTDAQVAEPVQ